MLTFNKSNVIKVFFSLGIMLLFSVLPAVEPITEVGMSVIGVFIGIVLLISLVDTTWPSLLVIVLFGMTGVMSVKEAIMGSLGSWVTVFVLMSFILTYSLNETGFTTRLTRWFLSKKFVNKSPWTFTFSLITLSMLVGLFLDPVPVTAFFLMFGRKLFEELGYEKGDKYPAIVTMGMAFAIKIADGMTPISHPLAIIGMGIYNSGAEKSISLLDYLMFGMPIGLLIFVTLCIVIRVFAKPDFKKFESFNINEVLGENKPMDLREKITVGTFFITAIMWLLPGILGILSPGTALEGYLNKMGPTFVSIIAIVLLAVIHVDDKPVLNLRAAFKDGINWAIIFLVGAAILLGGGISNPATGVTSFIAERIVPFVSGFNIVLIVFFIALVTSLMTNFSSNVTTVIVMTTVAISVATGIDALDARAIALVTTFTASLAFCVPSSFAAIAMLYGDDYSHGSTIFKYGLIMIGVTTVFGVIGYFLALLI